MRVTQRLIERTVSQNLTDSLSRLAEAQRMEATGIRAEKPSDDPVAAAEVMGINQALRDVEQFRRNTSAGRFGCPPRNPSSITYPTS